MTGILGGGIPVAHDNGMFISEKISRIVELIREYDPRLDVKFVPPNVRDERDPAFAITERLSDGREVVTFYVQSERDFDETVLARIYQADGTKHDVQSRIENHNRARRELLRKEQQEELEDHYDLLTQMVKTPLHTYKHNGRVHNL